MNNDTEILDLLTSDISYAIKINLLKELEKNRNIEPYMLKQKVHLHNEKHADVSESGFYGNVWIRKQYYPTKATIIDGHTHNHDHMSLLAAGRVLVEVEGCEPKEFTAPTFITISANKHHKITALEDETISFCVFAVRDEDGKSAEEYYAEGNSPYEDGADLSKLG